MWFTLTVVWYHCACRPQSHKVVYLPFQAKALLLIRFHLEGNWRNMTRSHCVAGRAYQQGKTMDESQLSHTEERETIRKLAALCVWNAWRKKSQKLIGNNFQDILLVVFLKSEKQDTMCMRLILHVGVKRNRRVCLCVYIPMYACSMCDVHTPSLRVERSVMKFYLLHFSFLCFYSIWLLLNNTK